MWASSSWCDSGPREIQVWFGWHMNDVLNDCQKRSPVHEWRALQSAQSWVLFDVVRLISFAWLNNVLMNTGVYLREESDMNGFLKNDNLHEFHMGC